MSNIDNLEGEEGGMENQQMSQPDFSKRQMHSMIQELEIMAMQKGGQSSIEFNKLDSSQIDKVLETMADNEKNAFAFHTKRIDAMKEIELRKIDASVIHQKTLKIVLIGVIVVILPVITLSILFLKENFFIPWLTFLTGILGGFGLSKAATSLFKPIDTKNPIKEDEDMD